ncbi:hypothetical protein LTR85_010767 [Meristemomyces frigidus]|nr:hypothetical protein LTR85_010767 [Meristemomyces frigidus]
MPTDQNSNPSDGNAWETAPYKADLVDTPSSRMFLTAEGAPRQSGQPIVIFESGAGAASTWWSPVARLVVDRVRVLMYDRSGLGRSEASAATRTAENMAGELLSLLDSAHITPPYLLVAHSYGGLIAREFLAGGPPGAISGMVLIDTNTEKTYAEMRMPMDAAKAILKDVDYMQITGISTQNSFTAGDLARNNLDESSPHASATSEAEQELMPASAAALAQKGQLATHALGSAPLTVIRGDTPRDISRIVASAFERKLGTPEQRAELKEFAQRLEKIDRSLQMEQLALSSNARFVQALSSGHHVQVTEPELVAREILRIMDSSTTN